MARIAFLTMGNPGGFVSYDELTVPPLEQLGHSVDFVVWDEPDVIWTEFDLVVIRTPWDYQHQAQRFLGVLESIEDQGVLLANPLEVCRWNIHKSYLGELAEQGIPVVPTRYFDAWPGVDGVSAAASAFGTDEVVIKPTVGASAEDTYRLHSAALSRQAPALAETFAQRPFMLQPFLKHIVEEGEYSLFYFNGAFSHAILKTPKSGDFRVQEEHGGIIKAVEPESALQRASDRIVQETAADLLYARVDMVRWHGDDYRLIELELIEPSLYFPYDEQSPVRFAEAINELLA